MSPAIKLPAVQPKPNHGKLFKTLLRAYLPDYETLRPVKYERE